MSDSYERTLQIIFGLVGVLSTILTLAGLHNRDSLGCILFRRIFSRRDRDRDVDPETEALSPFNNNDHLLTHGPRRPTMPPSYACLIYNTAEPPCSASSTPSHAGNVIDMGSNADVFSPSMRTASSTHLQAGNALNAASDTDISTSSGLAPPTKPRAGDAMDTCVNTVLGPSTHSAAYLFEAFSPGWSRHAIALCKSLPAEQCKRQLLHNTPTELHLEADPLKVHGGVSILL